MKKEIQKKHKAPKGLYGHVLIIILGLFLLIQPWFSEIGLWPIVLILLGISFMVISHYKQRRKRKKQELKNSKNQE